jgi:Rne/Rng family ribonuclease
MTREMYVSSTPHETKVALVEDDQLAEIFYERENEYTLAGSIYKGRVTRVLPGMQSAFVDIGLERDAFLYVSDFLELPEDEESEFDEIAVTRPEAFVSNRPATEPRRFDFKREPAAPAEPEDETSEPNEEAAENSQEIVDLERAGEERPEGVTERFRANRRRRRGRRGRGFPENKFARSPQSEGLMEEAEPEPAPEEDMPGNGYEPVILPGESLSKYRSREVATPAETLPAQPEVHASSAEARQPQAETEAPEQEAGGPPSVSPSASESAPGRRDSSDVSRPPMVLPGESIAKYQPREGPAVNAEAESKPSRYERRDRFASHGGWSRDSADDSRPGERRPRPEREPQEFAPGPAGMAVLPGESIAKYRNAPAPAQTEALSREQAETAAEEEQRHAPQAATFVIESEPWSETLARDSEPQASGQHAAASPAAGPAEQFDAVPHAGSEQGQKAAASAPERTKPTPSEQERFEQMNVAAVFGGNAAESAPAAEPASEAGAQYEAKPSSPSQSRTEPPDTGELDERIQTMIIGGAFGDVLEDEELAAEEAQPAQLNHAAEPQPGVTVSPESLEPAAPDEPAVEGAVAAVQAAGPKTRDEHIFGHPGKGTLEHEEIEGEEEEHGFHPPAEEEPDAEYLELEEETLEAGASAHAEDKAERLDSATAGQFAEATEELAPAAGAEEPIHEVDFDADTEFEEEELIDDGEDEVLPEEQQEEAIGRAEVRAPAATAGYQRTADRAYFDRRSRPQRGRSRILRRREAPRQQVQISDLLKEGQEVLVQIAKEPIGKKGARITSHIALPGRFLVYMPTVNHIGVSRKISSDEERMRLKRIMLSEREGGHGGFIVRTAAAGVGEDELRADIRFLKNLWAQIKQRTENSRAPALIYHDLNLVERVLRDQVTNDFSQIWVDTEQEYERILNFANRFQPALVRRVKLYTRETPLFDQFGIQEEINKALRAKVWLKSGGYIVINQTEALVAIDINTGKYVGKTARLEDTIVKTNVDAIKEIVRQIRLRDLGGIIVIDFIDMDERKNRQKVMQALEEALRSDRAPSKVLAFNDFGLVAITRKRVKQSLERTLGSPCPYCSGNGFVKSVTTVCNEIFVELRKIARHLQPSDVVTLRVNPEVAKALKADKGKWLFDFEELTGRTVLVKPDPLLHQEHFDIH